MVQIHVAFTSSRRLDTAAEAATRSRKLASFFPIVKIVILASVNFAIVQCTDPNQTKLISERRLLMQPKTQSTFH